MYLSCYGSCDMTACTFVKTNSSCKINTIILRIEKAIDNLWMFRDVFGFEHKSTISLTNSHIESQKNSELWTT